MSMRVGTSGASAWLTYLLMQHGFIGLLLGYGLVAAAQAQSDPGDFATVINVPPDVIGDFAALEKNTQVNVLDGGQVGVVVGSNYN
ncbi:MAG: hypothetical protein ACLFSC_11345, partial [Wenzhouxiangella sp.]